MRQLVKSELKYFAIAFTAPIFFLLLFSAMELFLFSNPAWFASSPSARDSWGGFYLIVLLISFGSIWANRFKEKRITFFAALPVTVKEIALARFWFAVLPFTAATLLIVLLQVALGIDVPSGFGSLILQTGLAFVVIAAFIRIHDEWFSPKSIAKRVVTVSAITLISLAIDVLFIIIMIDFERGIGNALSFFSKLIFYFFGLIIMLTTIPAFQKKKDYLN